jgi:hypothetical protein
VEGFGFRRGCNAQPSKSSGTIDCQSTIGAHFDESLQFSPPKAISKLETPMTDSVQQLSSPSSVKVYRVVAKSEAADGHSYLGLRGSPSLSPSRARERVREREPERPLAV